MTLNWHWSYVTPLMLKSGDLVRGMAEQELALVISVGDRAGDTIVITLLSRRGDLVISSESVWWPYLQRFE